MNRGEVWWAETPEAKRRPYLVLSRGSAIPLVHSVIAVPATRRVRGLPTEVELDGSDGMPEPCALSFDNVTVMPKSVFTERLTRLGADRLAACCRALAIATGC